MSADRQPRLRSRNFLIRASSKVTTIIARRDEFADSPDYHLFMITSTCTNPSLDSAAGIRFALAVLPQPMASKTGRVASMNTKNDYLFLIVGAVMYVWATIVFADYLTQSLWQISSQASLMIEPGVEQFF